VAAQVVHGVEVRRWERDFAGAVPGDVVVEAFACRLPDAFEAAMAEGDPKPVWINLDYLLPNPGWRSITPCPRRIRACR
jgi:Uncharacterized protein conserved in bacteria